MIDLLSLNYDDLLTAFQERGLPKYRAGQVFDWL